MAHSLRFYANGVNFQVVSGQSSCLAHVCLTQPPWWHVHFSVKVDSSEKDSGRLVEHKDVSLSFFWPLSNSPSYFSVAAPYSLLMPLVACKWLS